MFIIDGSQFSGSGTIVRYAVSLSALMGEDLQLTNIRAKREKPGLRPQHLSAVEAVKEITGGQLDGSYVGSSKIEFKPGKEIKGGDYNFDIGTAGSTMMFAQTVLPVGLFASSPVTFKIKGGVFQDFAPSAYHTQYVLFPYLKNIGADLELKIEKVGYVPQGKGEISLHIYPLSSSLKPLALLNQGSIIKIEGIALSSHLKEKKVGERMAEEAKKVLQKKGYKAEIKIVDDNTSVQPGAALALFAYTNTGCIIGADMAGAPGRSSEKIGRKVAQNLIEDIESGATVDRFLADQLIIYSALAEGTSEYIVPRLTSHIETNLWLVEKIIGAKTEISVCVEEQTGRKNKKIKIEGIGLKKN